MSGDEDDIRGPDCSVEMQSADETIVFLLLDMYCERMPNADGVYDTVKVYLTGNKPLVSGILYQLMVNVLNPTETVEPQNWGLRSFNSGGEPLDDVFIHGFQTNPRLNNWVVLNVGPDGEQVTKGKAKVRDLTFTANFPTPLKDGDVLRIEAPRGFVIRADGIGNYCNEFEYPDPDAMLIRSAEPECRCTLDEFQVTSCYQVFTVDEGRNPAFPQGKDFIFRLTTTNPKGTPPALENFWRIYHFQDGDETRILGSDSAPSWPIRPQIEGLQIALAGVKVAALQYSALKITFFPVMSANTMILRAVHPTGFDFSNSIVTRPRQVIKSATEMNEIAIDNLGAIADMETMVKISEVRLGRGGGQTIFDMVTYNGTAMKIVRDERYGFDEGFRLPGALEILEKSLASMFQEQMEIYPVRAIFPATVEEQARASLTFSVTQTVYARERLIIESAGQGAYELMPDGFVLLGRDLVEND